MTDQKPQSDQDPKIQVAMTGQQFKHQVIESLIKPSAMPMLVVWLDAEQGWCLAVGNDLHKVQTTRKTVATLLFKLISELKLFEEISTKAD